MTPPAVTPRPVWIDTDPAVGQPGADVDDGYALLQALRSSELEVVGISTVFGNAPRPIGDRIIRELLTLAGMPDIPVHSGASKAEELERPTSASRALARELRKRPLTILALGPLTNIATVLASNPELTDQIDEIVFVGGRRPGQRFSVAGRRPLPDFNLECDPLAAERTLETSVPLTLAGFEVSTHATIVDAHLDRLAAGPPAAQWLAANSRGWMQQWRDQFEYHGFHPFDTLAVATVATPQLITLESASASLVPVDCDAPGNIELHAALGDAAPRPVRYSTRASPRFVEDLMSRLLT